MVTLSTAREIAGDQGMYRVAFVAVLAASLGLGACSLNTAGISSGFNDLGSSSTTTGSVAGAQATRSSLSGGGTQVAALSKDQAPTGSYEKAPSGALSDRDYSATALDPEKARDLINQYRSEKGLKP